MSINAFKTNSVEERVQLLKERIKKVHEHVASLLWANESNRLINYTPLLNKQIPRSYAGHAYNLFRDQMHAMVIVKFCAIWDGVDTHSINIPTIIHLLESPGVMEALLAERREYALNQRIHDLSPTPINTEEVAFREKMLTEIRQKDAESEILKVQEFTSKAVHASKALMESPSFKSLMNLRHKVAHLLVMTRAEVAGPVDPAKYGDESKLIEATIAIIEDFYIGVCDTGFDWDGLREMVDRSNRELWENCTFNIPKH